MAGSVLREEVFGGARGIEQNISCFVQSVPSTNPVPRKTVLGRSVGVRLSFFADAFEGALTKTEQNNLFLTLRCLMAYSVSQKAKIPGRALEMPAGARSAAGGGR